MRPLIDKLSYSVWLIAAVLSFWSFGYTMLAAGDLWWHLAAGQLIVQSKSVPAVDAWSFTRESSPWFNHEWLSDVIYYLWSSAFGMPAIVYWKWGVIIAAFLALLLVCRRACRDFLPAYVATLFGLAVAAPFLDIRPHLYSLLGYALLLFIAMRSDRALPIWLPVLFLLWVNLHGGFFFGLIALAIIVALSSEWRKNLRVFGLCVVACFINPNGIHAFLYPLRYALDRDSPYVTAIAEWASPFKPGGINSPLYPYALAAFVLTAGFLTWKRAYRDRAVLTPLALAAFTLAMSLTSRRFIPLFAMSQAIVVAIALARLMAGALERVPMLVPPLSVPPLLVPPLAALTLAVFLIWPYPKSSTAFHYLTAEDEFPVEVCNFIEVNNLSGNVFAYYNWGGYLHLRTAGRVKVFIDSRADTVFSDETLRQYDQVQGFKQGWQQVIESTGAEFILWPRDKRGRQLVELVQSGRWQLLYDDAVSALLVRTDRAPAQLRQTPESGHKHLALGVKSFEQGQYENSEREIEKAISMLPASSFACRWLADVHVKQGRSEQAASQVQKCKKCFPSS
jgi:hypothetical protein